MQSTVPVLPVVTDPLTVEGVTIDRTAQNAVIARDEAIVEARRAAFQNLAKRNMSPEDFAALKMPDDSTLATLVQDFEIKREQLSTTRYVANFTVRFRDAVRNFVDVKPLAAVAETTPVLALDPAAAPTVTQQIQPPAAAVQTGTVATQPAAAEMVLAPSSKFVLVLPYLQNFNGKTALWEDPNPWRQVWQNNLPKLPGGGPQYIVPLGDISDVSAGSSEAVWSGDYHVIEKLRENYNADEVVLPVANKSSVVMSVDIYTYKDGNFARKGTITPIVRQGVSDAEAFHDAAAEVMRYLQRPVYVRKQDVVASISRELVTDGSAEYMRDAPLPPSATTRPPLAGGTQVDAAMSFDSFVTWMETQRRLSALVPPVSVDIKKISKNGAQFTMRFDGDMQTLQRVLAEQGIQMNRSAVEINPAALQADPAAAARAPAPVYDLRLVN